jgi:hypothetical protein
VRVLSEPAPAAAGAGLRRDPPAPVARSGAAGAAVQWYGGDGSGRWVAAKSRRR